MVSRVDGMDTTCMIKGTFNARACGTSTLGECVMSNTIRIIVFKEGDLFVAQALEVDIAAQASTADEAIAKLSALVRIEDREAKQAGGSLFDIGPAPATVQAFYDDIEVRRDQIELAAA